MPEKWPCLSIHCYQGHLGSGSRAMRRSAAGSARCLAPCPFSGPPLWPQRPEALDDLGAPPSFTLSAGDWPADHLKRAGAEQRLRQHHRAVSHHQLGACHRPPPGRSSEEPGCPFDSPATAKATTSNGQPSNRNSNQYATTTATQPPTTTQQRNYATDTHLSQ